MDEEDDGWSYSFPPSTEDITSVTVEAAAGAPHHSCSPVEEARPHPLIATAREDEAEATRSTNSGVSSSRIVPDVFFSALAKETVPGKPNLLNGTRAGGEVPFDIFNGEPLAFSAHIPATDNQNSTRRAKQLSLVIQPAFMLKLAPADPQTTRKDANLIISRENASNALASTGDHTGSPSSSPALRSDFKNSMKMWHQKTNEDDFLVHSSDQASENEMIESASPKIITYRKTTHVRKVSNSLKPEGYEEKFDPKLYVSEKYKNTGYRYATMKRNIDFHQLFKSIDLTDRLLDDFACAISREILLQGRVYITEQFLCFNSNLLGWVTSLTIPYSEITRIDKKSTAGLFPNGITVETKTAKHTFASFLSRDATFDFMRAIWLGCTGRDVSELDTHPAESFDAEIIKSSERRISNYIMSIDEGDNVDVKWNDEHFDNLEEEEPSGRITAYDNIESGKLGEDPGFSQPQIKTMRPGSTYKNMGPDTHAPTKIPRAFEGSEEEIEVVSDIIEAPLGAVFEILFGRENQTFHIKTLKDQGATEITKFGDFQNIDTETTQAERSYTYQRPLGYSIGPKSTKCCVRELVEHLDFNDYVVILSITDTPDVPSGGSFSVLTRYYLTWADENFTSIKISYHIKWIGRSWIKSMVEKLTQSAQSSVSAKLVVDLKKEVELQTQYTNSHSPQNSVQAGHHLVRVPSETQTSALETITSSKITSSSFRAHVVFFLILLVIVSVTFMLFLNIRTAKAISDFKLLLVEQQRVLSMFVKLATENNICFHSNISPDEIDQMMKFIEQVI